VLADDLCALGNAWAARLLVLPLGNNACDLAKVVLDKTPKGVAGADESIEALDDAGFDESLVENLGCVEPTISRRTHDDGLVGSRLSDLGQASDIRLEDMC
jgi:hypothetical protein